MEKYLLDFQLYIKSFLPVRKRRNRRTSLIFQGMKWLRKIHDEFLLWGPEIRNLAKVNNQVINLQDYLRTRFGSQEINIVHSTLNPSLLGRPADTLFLVGRGMDPTSWIGRAADQSLSGSNFAVQVPSALQYDENELRAVIDFYKVPGSSYIIQPI